MVPARSIDPISGARRASGLVSVVAAAFVAVALAALAAGCSPATDDAGTNGPLLPADVGTDGTTTTTAPDAPLAGLITIPPGFVAPDNRAINLPPVTGKPKPLPEIDLTQPHLPIQGGTAKLSGTVFGPDGPVEHARVRLERWVGLEFGRLDVETDKDGRYEAQDLLGGRYKVRAWVTDASLATVTPQLTFLAAKDGDQALDVTVERHDGLLLQGALDRAEPHVGEPATLLALLAQEYVDDDGIIRGRGIPDAVLVAHASLGEKVDGDGYGTTNPDGYVIFGVSCTGLDTPTVVLESSGLVTTVTLPECKPADEVTTTTTSTTTTTTAPTTTTPTTRPGKRP